MSTGLRWAVACLAAVIASGSVLPTAAQAQNVTWGNGNGGSSNLWSGGNNNQWSGGSPPANGSSLFFAPTTRLTSTNNIATGTFTSLTFNSGAGAMTISGSALTLTAGAVLTNNSTNLQTIDLSIALTAATGTIAATSGNFALGGVLSGTNVTFTGLNTTLSGLNTYTGTTSILSGTVTASNIVVNAGASNLGNATSAVVLGDSATRGTLSYTGTSATFARGFSLGAGGGALFVTQSGSTLTLQAGNVAGSGTFTVGGAGNTTISSILAMGSGGLVKQGAGVLTLTGANTYTGATSISAGVVNVQNATGLGTTAGGVTVSSGAALELQGGITIGAEALSLVGTGVSSNGALRNISGTNTYGGLITLTGVTEIQSDAGLLTLSNAGTITGATFGLTVDGAGDTSIASIIGTTTGGLTKNGAGVLTLTGANTYTGATSITAGVVNVQNATGLGTIAGGVTVTSGAALELQGGISIGAEDLSLAGTGLSSGGALRNISGNNTYGGLITLTGATEIQSDAGLLTLSNAGTITGATFGLTVDGVGNTSIASIIGTTTGGLTKNGEGVLTLTGANTYTGATSITAGVVNVQNATGLGTTAGGVTVTSGAALELQGGITIGAEDLSLAGTGLSSGGALRNISGNNTYGGALTQTAATRINSDAGQLTLSSTISGGFGLTFGGAGNTVVSGTIATGANTLTKDGAGTLTLSAANSFSGTTVIQSGAISVGSVLAGAVNQPLGTGARLDLGVANTSSGRLLYTGGSGTLSKNVFALGNGTDTIENAGTGLLTLSGALTKNGTVLRLQGGAQGITVTGTIVGSLANSDLAVQNGLTTLSAANTYTGPTFVNSSGTLALGVSNAIPSNSAVTLGGSDAGGNGGTGVLSMGSFTNQIGSLAFAGSGGTIRMVPTASATSAVVLSATGAINLAGTTTLDLTGMATGAGRYRLIAGSSLTDTFDTVTGLDANYVLRYGTLTTGQLDAQRKANQATTFTMTTASSRALVNTTVAVSGTITNTSPVDSTALTLGLASTGLTGSGFTTGSVAPGASTAVSGTLAVGSIAGTQNWSITNTDNSAITTTSTATGSLIVVNVRSFTVDTTPVSLGRFLITGSAAGSTSISSTGAFASTESGTIGSFASLNGLTLSLTSGSAQFLGASASQTAGYTLGGIYSGAAGAISGTFSTTASREFSSPQTLNVAFTGNAVAQRTFTTSTSTLALGFVHAGGSFSSPTLTVTSTGLNATTESGTLGSFSGGPGGFALNLTTGSASFVGASSPQSTIYTLSGSTGSLGAISGTYSSTVTREFSGTTNITVAVSGQVYSGLSTWATNGGGDWGTFASGFGANWGTNQGSPGLDAAFANTDTATFGSVLTSGTAAINTNGANISLKSLSFTTAAGSYSIFQTGGSGPMTLLAAGTNSAGITVTAGSHAIHADVTLGSNTVVDVASNAAFTFHNAISGSAAFGLTKTGLGTLFFNGNSNDYAGNTDIAQGVVSLLSGVNPLGTGTVTVRSGATLDFNFRPISNVLNVLSGGILLNTGSGQVANVSNNTIFTGTTNGTVNVLSGGVASFQSSVGAFVTVSSGGLADFTALSNGTPTVDVLSGGVTTVAGTAAGSYQVAGTGSFSGLLTGGIDVVSGGVVNFNGSNGSGSTFNVASGGLANVGSAASIGGQLHVSGSAVIAGAVAAGADVIVEAGGVVKLLDGAAFNQTSLVNNGLFVIDRTTPLTLSNSSTISGTGGLQKLGPAALTIAGSNTYTGPTSLDGGSLVVNGSLASGVAAAAGTTLAGSGAIAGALSGAGLVSPGASPGILAAGSFDPTGGLDTAFEFTAFNPDYAQSGAGALNDVLRLTDASTPFASSLTAANVVNVYFNVATINGWDTFTGGFFTDKNTDFLASINNATYNFYVRGNGSGTATTFNGQGYYDLATWGAANIIDYQGVTRTTTQVASANFASGTVTNGWVTQFIVVPEPSTIIGIAGAGAIVVFGRIFRRRKTVRVVSDACAALLVCWTAVSNVAHAGMIPTNSETHGPAADQSVFTSTLPDQGAAP